MPEPIRLYLDEDTMSHPLVGGLRSRSVDILTAKESGLVQIPDEQHVIRATALNRTVFTFNVRDFARLHAEFLAIGRHHAGIIVSDQLQAGVILRRLLKLLATRTATEMRDCLEFLGNWR